MKMNEQPDLDPQSMVERFHRLFDILVQQTPGQVDERTRVLRERLIQEVECGDKVLARRINAAARSIVRLTENLKRACLAVAIPQQPP
mgnify:CR=1 FL=1